MTGIVLAGGASTRLGRNKALVEVGGHPVLQRVLATLATVADDILLVEAPGPPRDLPWLAKSVRRVSDHQPGLGPLAGLHAGLSSAADAFSWVVACDLPFLHAPLLRTLMERTHEADAVVPVWAAHPQPLCAVYRRECLASVESLLTGPDRSLRALLAACNVHYISEAEVRACGASDWSFLSVNTQTELDQARRHAESLSDPSQE